MQAGRKITDLSVKHSFTLYPSLSPYRRTESQFEERIHSLRVGWRNLPTLRVGWRKYRNLFLFLINTLLLYPSLSPYSQTDRLTDRLTDRQRNKLILCGLATLTGSSRLILVGLGNLRFLQVEHFFQLCCCVSFWFWREIGFGFTYLCT
jgi:hypothetical protein